MGDFDCPHKFAQRDYVIETFEGVRAKNPSLTRMIFIDTPTFSATNYFIWKGLNPRSLVAVCNQEFQVAPPGGITTINRDIYELEESEVVNVAVAWIDTCDTNIGYSRDWFKDSLDLFAAVPVVMVVNAFRGSRFMHHPGDMLPFYVRLHQEGARKGEATQVLRYHNGKKKSEMIFSYSFLSGFAQLPFKCPSPLANGEDGEDGEEAAAEAAAEARRQAAAEAAAEIERRTGEMAGERERFESFEQATAAEIAGLRKEIQDRQKAIEAVDARLAEARKEKKVQSKEITALRSEAKKQAARLAKAEQRAEDLDTRLKAASANLADQETQADELTLALEAANELLADRSGLLEEKGSAMSAAASMLANLKPMLAALEDQLTDEERAKRAKGGKGSKSGKS